jgi:imidazoleglycerol-phosphate dehydratase/histidinol-phosphatase
MKNNKSSLPVLFIDRDGTIIKEPVDEQVDSLGKLDFLPKVIRNLYKIRQQTELELVMVTNQDGLGTESFPMQDFELPQKKMLDILEGEGVLFDAIKVDDHFPEDNSPNRKPGTGMLTEYMNGNCNLERSLVIGDRLTDIELAKNLGCKAVFIGESTIVESKQELKQYVFMCSTDWDEIGEGIIDFVNSVSIIRNTKETQITLKISRGSNKANKINTGLKFFDHMLDQIARHSGCSLQLTVKGDLEVDEHHTIEDTAIVLGQAYNQLLGNKIGINRYGFLLPMDDAQAKVAIDFSGRPWFKWNVDFTREYVGDFPTEMASHFFKTFSDNAQCNLHIEAGGENSHHVLESVFKGVAKAIKDAITRNNSHEIPSTKGVL